jgi:hypothetical protein
MYFLILSKDTIKCPNKVRVSLPEKYKLNFNIKSLCGSLRTLND